MGVSSVTDDSKASLPPTASEFLAATTSSGGDQVYMATPKELEEISDLVLSGRVLSVKQGPSYALESEPQGAFSSVYIEVAPDSVVAGDYPTREGVWIVINYVGPTEYLAYEKFLPSGTPVVAYLHEIDVSRGLDGGEESWWTLTPDSDSRTPGNGRLWIASSQGLVFDFGGDADNLAWPLLNSVDTGKLADTLPSGNLIAFPPDYVPYTGAAG